MKKAKMIITLISASILLYSCDNSNGSSADNYSTKSNSPVWAETNLDVSSFRNGDEIPEAKTDEEWDNAGKEEKPAWCYYNNDPANGKKYGKLYNWFAVNDPRGLAPDGWHVASDAEFKTLVLGLGGQTIAGKKMKATSGWNEESNGTNESRFGALPAGFRNYSGVFGDVGENAHWWTSTENSVGKAFTCFLNAWNLEEDPKSSKVSVSRSSSNKRWGYSVRCCRN